jgi:two-component system sensor histidine kinase TctE
MFWKPVPQLSLRVRLLVILIPVLTTFSAASLFYTREDVIRSTNAAYDRSLLGVIKSINLNVSNSSGGLSVELPYRQFEFFELTASGNVYFKVSTPDGLVQVGNHDLPGPPVLLSPGKPIFYDAIYFDQVVRVGTYLHSESTENRRAGEVAEWVVQVAEGVQSRESFATSLIQRAMLRDSAMLLLIWLGVGLGLAYGLKPLIRLVRQVGNRQSVDLTPLPQHDIPSELQPLIVAINHQLQRTERLMAERRSFIDDASHQLRTPLSVLQMQIDYALRESNSSVRYEVLKSLSNELTHAIRVTNQLLSLAESDASTVNVVTFDLAGLVRDVVLTLLPLAKAKSIDLGIDLKNDDLMAQGDAYLISQALSNIVHNAIQHGRDGGVVTVSASVDSVRFVICVLDDGPGISEDVIRRIGERFVKGKTSRGSGLGFAIARSVMAAHSGELKVHLLTYNSGTEVFLTWPKS